MSKSKEPESKEHDVHMKDADSSTQAKRKRSENPSSTLAQFTIRNPPWTYIHLSLISASTTPQLDALTAHLHLRAALSQFLGLHGTAIPIDILKLQDNHVHVRVPREDASALVIAVGSWVGKAGEGWRVKHSACWGPSLDSSDAADLFK